MKKLLSLALTILLIFTIIPIGAITVSAVTSGTTGDCTWTLNGTTLTISGDGYMADYDSPSSIETQSGYRLAPWYGTYVKTVVIEEGVKSIGAYAFMSSDITVPHFPGCMGYNCGCNCESWNGCDCMGGCSESCSEDCYCRYGGCSFSDYYISNLEITGVIVASSVERIGFGAFYGCDKIQHMTLPFIGSTGTDFESASYGSHTYLGSLFGATYYNESYNYIPSSLRSVTILDGCTKIGDHAFYGIESMTSISLPDTVTHIGTDAFSLCSVENFRISKNLISLESPLPYGSWEQNYSEDIIYAGKILYWVKEGKCPSDVIVNSGTVSIYPGAFYYADELKSISIPNSVNTIGYGTFENCTSLEKIYYCGTEQQWKSIRIEALNSPLWEAEVNYHNYGDWIIEEPTCTNNGQKDRVCSICNEKEIEIIAATEHNYYEIITPPTCTKGGYTTYTCSICGDSYIDDEVSALGHNYLGVTTEPTCTKDGYTTYTCSICGDSYIGGEVSALGHNYLGVTTEPTCTEDGYTTYTCSICGDSYIGDEVSALGHNYESEFTIDKEANDFEYGSKSHHCTRCDAVTDITAIPKTSLVSGVCGNNVLWAVTAVGILKIGGTGVTDGYTVATATPWYDYSDQITVIEIDETVTGIGNFNFYSLENAKKVIVNNSDMTFGKRVFKTGTDLEIHAKGGSSVEEYARENSITFIKSQNPEIPKAPELLYRSGDSIILKTVDGYEYSIDGVTWRQSGVFENLNAGTTYNLYQRIADGVYAPSTKSEALIVTTLLAPNAPTIESVNGQTVTLTKLDGYEYSMDGITWQSGNVFLTAAFDTELCFYQRTAANGSDLESPASAATKVLIVSAPKVFVGFDTLRIVYTEGYEYSYDGEHWQDSNFFEVLDGEYYTLYHRPKNSDGTIVFANETTTVFTNGRNIIESPTVNDLVWLKQRLLFPDGQNNLAADVNSDGVVNILDFICLNKQIVQDKVEFEGKWSSETTSSENACIYTLSSNRLECAIGDPLSKMSEEDQNGFREYCAEDIKVINGEEYYFGRGDGWEISCTYYDGETVTFESAEITDSENPFVITLKYLNQNTLEITACSYENKLYGIGVGTVFTKQ